MCCFHFFIRKNVVLFKIQWNHGNILNLKKKQKKTADLRDFLYFLK